MHKFTAEVYRYYNAAVHSTHSHPAPLQLPTDTQFAFSEWNTEDSQILRQYTSTSGDKISVSKVILLYDNTDNTVRTAPSPRLHPTSCPSHSHPNVLSSALPTSICEQ